MLHVESAQQLRAGSRKAVYTSSSIIASQSDKAATVVNRILTAGGSASVEQADVADVLSVRSMTSKIRKTYGRLDVLVNNAGRSDDGLLLLMPIQNWWSAFNDNIAPVVNCTRAALPLLMAARGRLTAIVNISSISGLRGVEGQSAYGASKAV